jgi:hypothetical protein
LDEFWASFLWYHDGESPHMTTLRPELSKARVAVRQGGVS